MAKLPQAKTTLQIKPAPPKSNPGHDGRLLQNTNQELVALQAKLDEQIAIGLESQRRVAFVENQRAELETLIKQQQEAYGKLKVEFDRVSTAHQNTLKEKLADVNKSLDNLESENKQAAIRFAQLGDIEKGIAIAGLKLLRDGKFEEVYVQQRNLVSAVGTKEANQLVAAYDSYQAKKYGLDGGNSTATASPPNKVAINEQSTVNDNQARIAALTKTLADNRKTLKDIQTKGTAIKRQMTRMEGTNSPIGQDKLKELENEFDKLQDEYRNTNSDISKIESDLKELGVDLGPQTQNKSTKKGGGI